MSHTNIYLFRKNIKKGHLHGLQSNFCNWRLNKMDIFLFFLFPFYAIVDIVLFSMIKRMQRCIYTAPSESNYYNCGRLLSCLYYLLCCFVAPNSNSAAKSQSDNTNLQNIRQYKTYSWNWLLCMCGSVIIKCVCNNKNMYLQSHYWLFLLVHKVKSTEAERQTGVVLLLVCYSTNKLKQEELQTWLGARSQNFKGLSSGDDLPPPEHIDAVVMAYSSSSFCHSSGHDDLWTSPLVRGL